MKMKPLNLAIVIDPKVPNKAALNIGDRRAARMMCFLSCWSLLRGRLNIVMNYTSPVIQEAPGEKG